MRVIKQLLIFYSVLFLLLISFNNVFATKQMAEIIIFEGEEHQLFCEPLEPYLNQLTNRPAVLEDGIWSTGNYRGYVGTWEIKNDSLWLIGIVNEYGIYDSTGKWTLDTEYQDVPISKIIEGSKFPVHASWYSDVLRIPQGEMLRYVHMGYGSIYEEEIQIKIELGVVINVATIDNKAEGLFRSDSDLEYCAIAGMVIDTGSWIDARLIPTDYMNEYKKSGEIFKTRGIYFSETESGELWIPSTPNTEGEDIIIHLLPSCNNVEDGSIVEIEASFRKTNNDHDLIVQSIRELELGETIHSCKFPEIYRSLKN